MKYRVYIPLLMLLFVLSAVGQTKKNDSEMSRKRKSLDNEKMIYLSKKIGLTSDQAVDFWTIYNDCEKQIRAIMKKKFAIKKGLSEGSTSADYEAANKKLIKLEAERASLRQTYYARYRKVLSEEQIFRYYDAEHSYRGELLKKICKEHCCPIANQTESTDYFFAP
ncbi:MAG: hypothetical protein LBS16_03120 [Prevotellaceae bacterium]|jgi:hypothetical protein|nr:hypothetical protein [Prevotellaceae bacterium]